ncbi:MAG: hypothetical protein R3E96_13730 [Planctomycetota bacterium]
MEEARRRGWPLVFGLPNRQSAGIFLEKLGWQGWGGYGRTPSCCGTGRPRGRSACGRGAWPPEHAAQRSSRGAHGGGRLAHGARHWVQERVTAFGPWAAELAAEIARDQVWMVRRDLDYLAWRYFGGPNAGRFEVLAVRPEGGAPAGFAVWQKPEVRGGVAFLVDPWRGPGRPSRATLAAALEGAHGAGACVLRSHAIDGSPWQAFLLENAFQKPKPEDEKWIIVHVLDPGHALLPAALEPALVLPRWGPGRRIAGMMRATRR